MVTLKRLDDFKYFNRLKRRLMGLRLFFLGLLAIGLALLLPYCGYQWMFGPSHPLSDAAKQWLNTIHDPIKVYRFQDLQPSNAAFDAAFDRLMQQLKEVLHDSNILQYEVVPLWHDPQNALALQLQYHLEHTQGVLIVIGDKHHFIPWDTFGTLKYQSYASVFLNALQQLTLPPKTVYWLTGHQEVDLKNTHPINGGSQAYQAFQQMNVQIRFLKPGMPIPMDADAVWIAGPKQPLLPQETVALQKFLMERNGHLCLCLRPFSSHGLDSFLKQIGVVCKNGLLVDNGNHFLDQTSCVVNHFLSHTFTKHLQAQSANLVFGRTTALDILPESSLTQPCLLSPATYSLQDALTPDAPANPGGSYTLGCVFETAANVFNGQASGKAVVLACTDWLENAHLHQLDNRSLLQAIGHYFWDELPANPWLVANQAPKQSIALSRSIAIPVILFACIVPFLCFTIGLFLFFLKEN